MKTAWQIVVLACPLIGLWRATKIKRWWFLFACGVCEVIGVILVVYTTGGK